LHEAILVCFEDGVVGGFVGGVGDCGGGRIVFGVDVVCFCFCFYCVVGEGFCFGVYCFVCEGVCVCVDGCFDCVGVVAVVGY